MSSAQDRPTGRETGRTRTDDPTTTGAHSAGYTDDQTGSGDSGTTGQYAPESAGYGRRAGAREYPEADEYGRGGTGPARHLGLAAALLMLSGLLTFFAGITGVIKGSFYVHVANYPFTYSIRSWGITELVIGAVVFAVGLCLLLGMQWARYIAIVIAGLSAILNFMFLPFYPLWAIVVIAIDVFIIWECAREDPRRRRAA
jgi:hypothetical protein